ncbi:MAG: hypothetical protein UX39_C0001G0034 [Candidatus Magasanikbacteria bacterium GW2011_GWA2_46_17]|uniref:Uncharacterized protein n=1 Tax=Candidatus Magasanikbacteria bacterium GW2011_GWA2_46_17 TaxID=1619042 RepID=A0A0G1P339_9BACT|nr:MAG: hypothetical protein UX39_C0001G0034 [Candidatus Magasanikbacteria bacterium GW2011_GWA2_46_17]
MRLRFAKDKIADPEKFIRRCGYGKLFDRRTGQTSYVKRLHGDLYPRFHVYIVEKGSELVFNLHLDQRATRYEGVTAHSGEYEGEVVEKEAGRIMTMLI